MSVAPVLSDTLATGTAVGSYVIVRPIAEGGMGAVYEAEHRVTGQRRALKVVRGELSKSEDFRQRFIREVTIASSVKHPNLVDTQDPIEEGGMLALPMELLEGETLSARIRRGRMTPHEMLEVVVPACRAVHAVHERNVIHRDLKPLNVFLAKSGGKVIPKVLDFGAARAVGDEEQTRTGLVIGSPFYMAPEQAEGRKDLDRRVDVYSLGVIAFQCLTGRRPYESDSAQSAIAKLIRAEKFPRPTELEAGVPRVIEDAVMKALANDREERWPSLAAFADALIGALRPTVGGAVGAPVTESTLLTEATLEGTMQLDAGELMPMGASGVRESTPRPIAAPPSAAPPTFQAAPVPRPTTSMTPSRTPLVVALAALALAAAGGWWWYASRESRTPPTPLTTPSTSIAPAPIGPAPIVVAPMQLEPELPPPVIEPAPVVVPPPAVAIDPHPPAHAVVRPHAPTPSHAPTEPTEPPPSGREFIE